MSLRLFINTSKLKINLIKTKMKPSTRLKKFFSSFFVEFVNYNIIFMNKLILFLIIPLFSYGQIMNVPDYEDTTMPLNPEEEAFTQYAHSPVSLARGELNFSVPIHTIKGKDLSLPISMSYRQGVKIHDVSQYTGHGWTLFAGGVITRRVNDLPDNSSKP